MEKKARQAVREEESEDRGCGGYLDGYGKIR